MVSRDIFNTELVEHWQLGRRPSTDGDLDDFVERDVIMNGRVC